MNEKDIELLKECLKTISKPNSKFDKLYFRNKCSKCNAWLDVRIDFKIQEQFDGWYCSSCGHKNKW